MMSLCNRRLYRSPTYERRNMNVIQWVKIETGVCENDQVDMARQMPLLSSKNIYWWAQEIP